MAINEETRVALTCPSCGNDQNFLVKTLQMHVVHLDDSHVEVSEEGRPAVLEILCDECETALKEGFAKKGDTIVVAAGTPVGVSGTTNMLKILSV